ncbi:MAG TPA: glycosyltransferase family 2 protein [Patescibacteria group bacterium]|nr:glycosyltransferase family 2 protein [Patescibacteria group bacterium]
MKKLPLTVVTPSYNQARFIQKTIVSVLSQKYAGLQYFVIDGKSTDATVDILKKYSGKLQWVSKKDKGQTDALNKGIRKSKCTTSDGVFAYINSDDYYLPGAFAAVVEIFQKHPEVMWVVGDAKIVDERGKEIQSWVRWYKSFFRLIYFPQLLGILNPLPQPAVFIRTRALKKVGLFNEKLHYTMDYQMWLRLQTIFGKPYFVDAVLAAFRIHGASKGTTAFEKQFVEQYEVSRQFFTSPLVKALQKLHNAIICSVYKELK